MTIPSGIAGFWAGFRSAVADIDDARFYEAFHFGDSEDLANRLAALVLAGTKRATAATVWSYELAGTRIPRAGDLSVVTDWGGTPLCVMETTRVDVVPFEQVSPEFAAVEGEGDRSLAYWRRVHAACFTRECAQRGHAFDESMLVACERFVVIYAP